MARGRNHGIGTQLGEGEAVCGGVVDVDTDFLNTVANCCATNSFVET